MNSDIRVSTTFRNHRKRRKLDRELGMPSGGFLVDLWIGSAMSRPDGILTGWDETDIAIEAGWNGDAGEFVRALVDTGWLDEIENGYALHDWVDHNGYAAAATDRTGKAVFSNLKRWYPDLAAELEVQGVNSITKEEYARITAGKRRNPSPVPNRSVGESVTDRNPNPPSPSPSPSKKTFSSDSIEFRLAKRLFNSIRAWNPDLRKPNLQSWAQHVDRMLRIDNRPPQKVEDVIDWATSDPFWQSNILSTKKLREKFDQLVAKMNGRPSSSQLSACGTERPVNQEEWF